MSNKNDNIAPAAAAIAAGAPETINVALRVDTPINPRDINVAAALDDQGTMDKALRYGKLAAEQSLTTNIQRVEAALLAANEDTRTQWGRMQEQAEREAGRFIAADKSLAALVDILNKTLRPKNKVTKKSLVLSVNTWLGHGLSAVSVDNLRCMFNGPNFTFQLSLALTLSNPNDRDEDESDYECQVKASPELLAKAARVREAFETAKRLTDELAELRRKLKELPNALNAMEAQVLAKQLENKPGGSEVVDMVRTTLGAHLQGSYVNLLG